MSSHAFWICLTTDASLTPDLAKVRASKRCLLENELTIETGEMTQLESDGARSKNIVK